MGRKTAMTSFASPVLYQLQYLVQGLTKKTQRAGREEIAGLVAMYGSDARRFLLTCLVDEIDFRTGACF